MEMYKDDKSKQYALAYEALKDLRNKKDKLSNKYLEEISKIKKEYEFDFIKINYEKLLTPVRNLEFSVRTVNCLVNLGIKDIGDLIQLSKNYLIKTPNFGRKSLEEIHEKLRDLHLKLNTNIIWPLDEGDLKILKIKDTSEFSEKIEDIKEKYKNAFIKENFEKLSTPIDKIGFSLRTINCLVNLDIKDIGDLIQLSESFLVKTPNFGRKSLNEIRTVLEGLKLNLNTEIVWPPENYKNLKKELIKDEDFVSVIDPRSKKLTKIILDKNSLNKNYLMDLIKTSLKEREYFVLKRRYWDDLTLEEIGQTEKVTRERIRQIESKSLRKIKKYKLIFNKFLELHKDEIFSKYASSSNLVTEKSLAKVKDKYPLNEYDGLVILSFELINDNKPYHSSSSILNKFFFFNKYFNALDGGWYRKSNIVDLNENTEELIYYLDKKPLPRQCESARELSSIAKEEFKDVVLLAESRSDYYLINNYLCQNTNNFAYLSNSYLVRMHEVLFKESPNTFIRNDEVMRFIKRDKFLSKCPYSTTIVRAKDLLRGKGLIKTNHLFYVTGSGIIPIGLESNNYFQNLVSHKNTDENLIFEEEHITSEKLAKYLKIIEDILKKYKAISLNKMSEIYVTRIDQKIKPQQALRVLGILLSSYEKFIQIGPGVWSLKNDPNPSQNLANFIIQYKESYPADMYSLIKYSGEDISVYPGCNRDFEKEICIRGETILNKNSYQSLIHVSDPEKWKTDNDIIKKFKELKKLSNFYLSIKASGTFNINDDKKIKSYDIDNLGVTVLNFYNKDQVSIVGLNKFFDYSLFWNTSTGTLVLLSYAGLIEVPKHNLKPYKVNKSKIDELKKMVLKEFIENGSLRWNKDFGKKIIEMIKSNYNNFINKDNWITEDLKLHDKI